MPPTDLVLRLGLLLVSLGSVLGCEARRIPKAGEPLQRQPEAKIESVRMRAPLGTRGRSPVVVALVGEAQGCDPVDKARGEAFFVCLWPSRAEPPAPRLRSALRELKRAYPDHVAQGAVSVFIEGSQTRDGMDLTAEEPGFFAGMVLEQADRVLVSNTRLYAYGQKGGKRVALLGVVAEEAQRAQGIAPAAGLSVGTFPPGPEGLASALRFVRAGPAGPPPGSNFTNN